MRPITLSCRTLPFLQFLGPQPGSTTLPAYLLVTMGTRHPSPCVSVREPTVESNVTTKGCMLTGRRQTPRGGPGSSRIPPDGLTDERRGHVRYAPSQLTDTAGQLEPPHLDMS